MKELEHKREVERLWQEKLVIYQAQRMAEEEELRMAREREQAEKDVVQVEKARLLAQHGAILKQFNPKASTQYGHLN
jgi:hypothetical protein